MHLRSDVRKLRGPRAMVDPEVPVSMWDEWEVSAPGGGVATRVVILAGAECRFTCVMCDLWRHTLPAPTASGRLTQQVRLAIAHPWSIGSPTGDIFDGSVAERRWIKLYNGSNFFDPRCVPPGDLPAIAQLIGDYERVIVENHPRLCDDGIPRFREQLTGRLEIAMGLETVHADVLPRLGKQMSLDDFMAACDRLRSWDTDIRAFVLLGLPWVDPDMFVEEAARGVTFAATHGARHVSVVPLRPGNGFIDALLADGQCSLPTAAHLERAAARLVDGARRRAGTMGQIAETLVTIDLWDWSRLAGTCAACRGPRHIRLARMNISQASLPPVALNCGCDHFASP